MSATDLHYHLPPSSSTQRKDRHHLEPMAYLNIAGLWDRKPMAAKRMGFERTLSTLVLARMLVPALHWPFPVIVQCCETEKAMCVDAKVNLAP